MEQLCLQLNQLEQDAKNKKPSKQIKKKSINFPNLKFIIIHFLSKITTPSAFANYDQFHANISSNIDVDPFQTVDPFASQSDIGSSTTTNDWFQSSNNVPTTNYPFGSKIEFPNTKNTAPKAKSSSVDPWSGTTTTTTTTITNKNGNIWTPFNTTNDESQNVFNENSSSGTIRYQALDDYKSERSDDMSMSTGDIMTVKIFLAYAERIILTPSSTNENVNDTTLQLAIGWFPRNYIRPAIEIEIQNNKNSTKNTPTSEKPLNFPIYANDVSSNDGDVAIYPFEATESTDLSFNIDGQEKSPFQETAIAITSFHTNAEDRLSFDQG
ncbi:unnamed protein product [Rotaria sp. Silwood1]|nr:unnamed protein product [Rotaria sp. Silwood1]